MRYHRFLAALPFCALLSGALPAAPHHFKGYAFEAYVVQSNGMRYREFNNKGQATLQVRPGEEYSIVLHNPLPVRAGVALSVDGLSTIDGKRSSPRKSRKWMIEPHSSITISGWQTSSQTSRKFVFTQDESSYAQRREQKEGRPYARNLGVIGAAWFWNAEELDRVLNPSKPFEEEGLASSSADGASRGKGAPAPSAPSKSESRAGTGMGRQERHLVTEVEFNPTAGMFAVRDVLKIFYEFAKEPPVPQPFISEEEESGRFAPEM